MRQGAKKRAQATGSQRPKSSKRVTQVEDSDESDGEGTRSDLPLSETLPTPPVITPLGSESSPTPPVVSPLGSQAPASRAALDIAHYFIRGDPATGRRAVCRPCQAKFDANPEFMQGITFTYSANTGTTGLRNHLQTIHLADYLEHCAAGDWKNQLPEQKIKEKLLRSTTRSFHQPAEHDPAAFEAQLVKFIVTDDQSLNVIECPEFRELLLLLHPGLQDTDIPHRSKLRELILCEWKISFSQLKADLAKAVGDISFTADLWSDQNRRSFLAITAHWIAEPPTGLSLQTALIAFHYLDTVHTGQVLAEKTLELLQRVDITTKIGHWTLDNASNNTTFMEHLGDLLRELGIEFDPKDRQIRCFPHIINRCVLRFVASIDIDEHHPDNNRDSDDDDDDNAPIVQGNPISVVRGLVKELRASGQRANRFRDSIHSVNANLVANGQEAMKELQVLRDVRHRWDSLYKMVERVIYLRHAIDFFVRLPAEKLQKYVLKQQDWTLLSYICAALAAPSRVQTSMCAEAYPTLSGTIPVFEQFMSSWEKLSTNAHLTNALNAGLTVARSYYERMDDTRAYVVAMFVNPIFRFGWIERHWDDDYYENATEQVKDIMTEYHLRLNATAATKQPTVESSQKDLPAYLRLMEDSDLIDLNMSFSASQSHRVESVESEFHRYSRAAPAEKGTNIIQWWEQNRFIFPTIFAIAMDYLPIQASSVPSERVFSSSAETDTRKRNRLSPPVMEALQMLKFKFKKERWLGDWDTPEELMMKAAAKHGDPLQKLAAGDEDAMDEILRMDV